MKENFKEISKEEFNYILKNDEGDYVDFANSKISGKRLENKIVSFANSEGGEVYIGIHDKKDDNKNRNDGFEDVESASKLINILYKNISPRIENASHDFLMLDNKIIVKLIIPSSRHVHKTITGAVFVRKGAESILIKGEDVKILRYKKGVDRYEDEIKRIDFDLFKESNYFSDFLNKISFSGNNKEYLKRNNFLYQNNPRISAILLFLDFPQSVLKSGIKIIRYEHQKYSRKYAYRRERVSDEDYTIEGPIEVLIRESIEKINEIIPIHIRYPQEAILESLVNAVLHRDYYIQNEIQVKIYDNRIEIISPGGFAGGVTSKNITRHERFSRNPSLVRTLFKISATKKKKDRFNQDQGEGIKTIINSMRRAGLADPEFEEIDNAVIVVLKHSNIESYESKIINYLKEHEFIANKEAREITGEEDKEKIKNVFKKLVKRGVLELENENAVKAKVRYKLKEEKDIEGENLKLF